MTKLEEEFNDLMVSIYKRAKSEAKYTASAFWTMVCRDGGLATAKHLLRAPQISEGFKALYLRQRLDLTVEAQLLKNEKFWELFEPEDIQQARQWLREKDYNF